MTEKPSPQKKRFVIVAAACLLIGVAAGFFLGYAVKPKVAATSRSIREAATQYKFIDPLLASGQPDLGAPTPAYVSLQKNIEGYIANQKMAGAVTDTSVYFVNYGQSGSFAINQDAPYDPASMLKVVVMVGYLKESDSDPSILDQQFTYDPTLAESLDSIPFEDPTKLTVGDTYTVSDLIHKMITDSDNGAMILLLAHIDNSYLNNVYTELGLKAPPANGVYTISAADYSLFFRILYNGTYLSPASSEEALSILSQATFTDGLVAGVPAGTIVAHKYGERVIGTGDTITSVELHDCGIVYATQGPYLLCVMTRGKTLTPLSTTIATISSMVYQQVSETK